ncbi:hypothetical protein E5Q_00674 [Mixia osmundae IAM 14324]|uniref:NTF2 domain-containing protein n=1 Tax=Mixia osmundae (strain CBS 9802 / IAM 14324 / JCM 22182 / KY 12970) TaxID=764103 RepID=G7DTW7_MIXOS|nr:hypothetical protein E5Q_00674 [Mixia osmundae IAM 14324]
MAEQLAPIPFFLQQQSGPVGQGASNPAPIGLSVPQEQQQQPLVLQPSGSASAQAGPSAPASTTAQPSAGFFSQFDPQSLRPVSASNGSANDRPARRNGPSGGRPRPHEKADHIEDETMSRLDSAAGRARPKAGQGRDKRSKGKGRARDELALDDTPSRDTRRQDRKSSNSTPYERNRNRSARGQKASVSIKGLAAKAIEEAGEPRSSSAGTKPSSIQVLHDFIEQRWNPSAALLDLSGMIRDPIWRLKGIKPPGTRDAPKAIAGALWKSVSQTYPQIVSLSLANNDLENLRDLSPSLLVQYLPHLHNLSLADNKIARTSPMNPIGSSNRHSGGLKQLEALVLTGNPITSNYAGRQRDYQRDVAKLFPALTSLDMLPIDRGSLLTEKETRFPYGMQPGFADSEGGRSLVAAFLAKFFESLDKSRENLHAAYAPSASFSYALNSMPPQRMVHEKRSFSSGNKAKAYQNRLDFRRYITIKDRNDVKASARNLNRATTPVVPTLLVGPDDIVAALKAMPGTSHPLARAAEFVFDVWTQPDAHAEGEVLFVTVHGMFEEAGTSARVSFDRAFILAPAAPDTIAHAAGWPCLIISDQLTLRGHSHASAWEPGCLAIANLAAEAPPAAITPQQEAMVAEFSRLTRLKSQFAFDCLALNEWDPTRSMTNFEQLRPTIPAEAFD